jgi:hypothetical protein
MEYLALRSLSEIAREYAEEQCKLQREACIKEVRREVAAGDAPMSNATLDRIEYTIGIARINPVAPPKETWCLVRRRDWATHVPSIERQSEGKIDKRGRLICIHRDKPTSFEEYTYWDEWIVMDPQPIPPEEEK